VILTDGALPADEEALIVRVIEADCRVKDHHKLRTRKAGSHRYVDVHIILDDTMSLVDAHAVAEEVEESIRTALKNCHPIIHFEPYEDEIARVKRRGGQ
jgi:divalent metal cation (Fe/Co/Zn/Cd) transporter